MISIRITGLFASIRAFYAANRRHSNTRGSRQRKTEGARRTPLRLEVLEDRCLLSATTTVPPLSAIPPLIALTDIMAAAQPKGNPSVVFVGDSISWEYAYGTGAPIWSANMAPRGMADYGVIGQTTQSLLFQFSLGLLTGINPSVVVLDIGGNDLLQGYSPQDTAAGVVADVSTIHDFLPQAQILVLGVLPGEQSPSNPYRSLGAQTNFLVSQMLAGNPQVSYVNLGSIFLQPDGTISNSMMFDYLHPTEQGYQILTNALLPYIEQLVVPNVAIPSISVSPVGSMSEFGAPTMPTPSSPLPMEPA
ncbi:MAG: GDSL-type esterase/lipase family protein [Gemmataceae bacterium]